MGLFILIKRKGNKKPLGAFPAKRGATRSQLNRLIKDQRKKGFMAIIVSEVQLKRIVKRFLPKRARMLLTQKINKKSRSLKSRKNMRRR